MMAGMGLLYAVFIALGGNHLLARRFSNPAIVNTLVYLVPLPIIMLPAGLLASVMVVQNQVYKLTVYNVLTSLLLTTSAIAACLAWKTPEAMILMKVGVSLAVGLAAILFMFQAVPKDSWYPKWPNMKTMVAYSIPLAGASALGTIYIQLDKLIVSSMCTPEQFAVYSNGAIEIPLIGILTGSIAAVIQPDLRRMVVAREFAGALALFRQSATKSAVFIIPAMVFLMVSAEPFILTLFSSRYSDSILPFRLYLLILPVRIVQFGSLMMALGMNRIILYRSFAGLCANLILSIILVRWLGYIGSIISTIICLYSVNVALNLCVISSAVGCRWWQVLPFSELFQLLWVGVLACIPILLLNYSGIIIAPVFRLVLDSACYAMSLAVIAWLFNVVLLKDEARYFWNKLPSRIRRAL
jgi:O-antigen/teichoic acid export membrane protein